MKRPVLILTAAVIIGASAALIFPAHQLAKRFRIADESLCHGAASAPGAAVALPHFFDALRNEGRVRIVAIGSSSTEGVGASNPAENYPSQLRQALEKALPDVAIEVVNLGVGGEVASQTALRLREDIPRLGADLILWQVGTNDGLAHVAPAKYQATLRDAMQFLKGSDADIMLVGMQWSRKFAGDASYRAIVETTERVAREEGVALVSRYDAMRSRAEQTGREEFLGPDRLHMNDLGYRCLAEQIASTFSHARDAGKDLDRDADGKSATEARPSGKS